MKQENVGLKKNMLGSSANNLLGSNLVPQKNSNDGNSKGNTNNGSITISPKNEFSTIYYNKAAQKPSRVLKPSSNGIIQ